MAWNEPGGGKDKDPWGGGGDQGPPDLDEALRKLQEKLNKIFRGGKGGGPRGGGGGFQVTSGLVLSGLAVLAIIWALSGFYQVDEQERAVILRFGKYHDTVGSGLHWLPRFIDEKTLVNISKERQYASRGMMLTEDENIVELPLTVQYNIEDIKSFVLNVKEPELSLEHATDSAVRHVVGSSKLDDVLSAGREQLGIQVEERLQRYLDDYGAGIHIINVNILEARPPQQVKAAYDDVVKAREDRERLINQAQGYANSIVPEARGQAQRMIEEASAYRDRVVAQAEGDAQRFDQQFVAYQKAPAVTRQRLYLETMQEVLGNTSKVLMDVEGGNNIMYLPLDKIVQQTSSAVRRDETLNESDLDRIAQEVIDKLRREQAANRRGGR